MVPGYVRAELEYRVYAPGAEPVIHGAEDFDELPDWVDVGVSARGSVRFVPPPIDPAAPAELRAVVESAQTMYRIVVSLPVRPFADLHLEYALEAAAEIAAASEGVVVDVALRWIWTAEEVQTRAEALDYVDQVRVVVEPGEDGVRRARSLGLRKFGYADVVAPEVPRGCAEAARRLVDDAAASLVSGEARPQDDFEHGGIEIAIRPEPDPSGAPGGALVLTRVDGGAFGEFLRDLQEEIEGEEGPQPDGEADEAADAGEAAAQTPGAEISPFEVMIEIPEDDAAPARAPAPTAAAAAAGPAAAVPDIDRTQRIDVRGMLTPAELRILVDDDAPAELLQKPDEK